MDTVGFEVDYLITNEWAKCAEDVLWRRTKLGLFLSAAQAEELEGYIKKKLPAKEHTLPVTDEEE